MAKRIAVRYSPSITMSAKEGMQAISIPTGDRNPREIAMALTAWLTAPAPTDCSSTFTPSLTMPAIAPATDAGEDLEETLRQPPSGLCSRSGMVVLHRDGAITVRTWCVRHATNLMGAHGFDNSRH